MSRSTRSRSSTSWARSASPSPTPTAPSTIRMELTRRSWPGSWTSRTPAVLEVHDPGQLLRVNSILIVDGAVGVGEGDALRAQLVELLDRVLRDIARPGDQASLALEI